MCWHEAEEGFDKALAARATVPSRSPPQVRGISRLDQAWLATIADKLEVSLSEVSLPQPGVGFGAGKPAAATGGRR